MPRILIAGNSDSESRNDVTAILVNGGHEWRLADVLTAPSVLRAWRPDAVIVDVPGLDFDGASITATLRAAEAPGVRTPIITLTPDTSLEARLATIRAGADDCMAKPIYPAELRARLRGLLVRTGVKPNDKPVAGQILAFYGAKGGSGTTTVAINAAIALRRLTKGRVCLVDGNLQFGDHRVFLDFGLDRPGMDDIVAMGIEPENILQNLVHHENEIDLLLAPKSPELADLISPDAISNILGQLRSRYDYIVIDVERHVDERALRVFDLADTVCLVLSSDLPCLKNTRLTLEMLRSLDFAEDRIRLLLNRADSFTGIRAADVETVLERRIDYRIANDYRSEITALNSGKPTMVARPESALGGDFAKLAQALVHPEPVTRLSRDKDHKPAGLLSATTRGQTGVAPARR